MTQPPVLVVTLIQHPEVGDNIDRSNLFTIVNSVSKLTDKVVGKDVEDVSGNQTTVPIVDYIINDRLSRVSVITVDLVVDTRVITAEYPVDNTADIGLISQSAVDILINNPLIIILIVCRNQVNNTVDKRPIVVSLIIGIIGVNVNQSQVDGEVN